MNSAALARPRPLGKTVIAAFAAVATFFVASTLYTQHRASSIDENAVSIATNAGPSIEHMASARGSLRRLEMMLSQRATDTDVQNVAAWRAIDSERRMLQDDVENYLSIPYYPHERELWRNVHAALRELDVAIVALREARNASEVPPDYVAHLHAIIERGDAAADRLIAFNAGYAGRLANTIEGARAVEMRYALGLDALSVALAIATAAFTLFTVRRYQRLVAVHQRDSEARAEELDAFAGRVAHDIKGPLSAALLWIDMTSRQESQEPALREAFGRMHSSLERVVKLVDALLVFARSGAHPDLSTRAPIDRGLADLREDLQPIATEAGVELQIESERYPVAVACAPGVLASVLDNLARNAIKFMGSRPEKRVQVRAWAMADRVRIEVEDTGPGMSPDLAKSCFMPFRRGADTSQPGTGLGLATVQRLVVAHHGAVGVDSHEGAGTLFWVELPRAA